MRNLYNQRKGNRTFYTDEIAVRGSIAGWWAAFLNVAILALTIKVVRLNQINVYLNAQNVINNRASAKSGEAILKEFEKINETLTSAC